MDRAVEGGVESLSSPPPPVSLSPCLSAPVSLSPCLSAPVSLSPCLSAPVSLSPCLSAPVSLSPCLSAPVSLSPCLSAPVSLSPCLSAPVSLSPCLSAPVSLSSCLSAPVSLSSCLSAPVSLSSCLSAPVSSPLSSSRKVTARLYSSLQHSREQEVRGHQTLTGRQVSFNVGSPLVTMTMASPSLHSDRLNESQEVETSLDVQSFSDVRISGIEEAESQPEPVSKDMDMDMDVNLQSSSKLLGGRWHIEEMENVRSHLQTMLQARATDTCEFLPSSTLQRLQDNESDTTSHLLSGVEELFPRYSRLCADFDSATFHSVSELQVIRESLEKEKARRKFSEQQLLAVQSKALELQQQLTLAVSADRKKDIMIEQLDKTLEKVVEGWRRHEREKSEGVRRLQGEKEAAESTLQNQTEALACLKNRLSEAAEILDKEQKHNKDLQNINKKLECEMAELRVCVCELEKEVKRLHVEVDEEKEAVKKLQTHNLDLQQQLEQHQLESKHTHTHLQQELTLLTQQLETERERVGQEVQLRQEAQSGLQQVQQDLEDTRRERDTARVDRALDQARFEAQRSQWEVELRLSVEQQVTERLATIQEDNANATAKLREQHRKQLLDLSSRHERELSVQVDEFRTQLKERDDRQHQITVEYNNKMVALQEELISMESSKRRLETQREELVCRLQGMMRSHWAEALRLLTNQEQIEGVLSSSSLWDMSKPHSSRQTQDSSICSTAAPQAVVLQMSRDRGIRGKGDIGSDRGRTESDFSLLNHSHMFSPLEPVLDDTHLTAKGGGECDLWDRPVEGKRETVDRGHDLVREGTETEEVGEMTESGEDLTLHSTHFYIQSDHRVNKQPYSNPNTSLNPNHRPIRPHASTDKRANQSVNKGVGQMCSSTETTAPSPTSNMSSSCDERQNELQYYVTKLLERFPGEPLEEHQVDQTKTRAETQSAVSDVSFQVDPNLEKLTDLLAPTLPSTDTTQQLQQLLHSFIRSGAMCPDPVRANLDRRLAQHDRKEQRQSAARSMQNTATRGRRTGVQGQKSGSKVSAWR